MLAKGVLGSHWLLLFKFQYPFQLHSALSISLPLLQITPYEWDMRCLLWLCCLNKFIAFLSYFILYNIIVNLTAIYWEYIDCLEQDFIIANALAMEILQSCTKPSMKYSIFNMERYFSIRIAMMCVKSRQFLSCCAGSISFDDEYIFFRHICVSELGQHWFG